MSRRARARFDRRVILNPIAVAIESAQLLPERDRTALQAIVRQAHTEFIRGHDCTVHWCVLADSLNVAETLARLGICSDEASRARITAGLGVLFAVHQRQCATGSWTLRSAELCALDGALWVQAVQLDHCSLGEYERAMRDTRERLRQARAGNAPGGALVVEGSLQ